MGWAGPGRAGDPAAAGPLRLSRAAGPTPSSRQPGRFRPPPRCACAPSLAGRGGAGAVRARLPGAAGHLPPPAPLLLLPTMPCALRRAGRRRRSRNALRGRACPFPQCTAPTAAARSRHGGRLPVALPFPGLCGPSALALPSPGPPALVLPLPHSLPGCPFPTPHRLAGAEGELPGCVRRLAGAGPSLRRLRC